MSLGGMAQALATYNDLSQRYGTGIDYFSGTRELMTVATTVNAAPSRPPPTIAAASIHGLNIAVTELHVALS